MSSVCFAEFALPEKAAKRVFRFRLLVGPAFAEAASRRQADAS
jgi:hypothetical protein